MSMASARKCTENESCESDNEAYLSDHCVAMRKAVAYCREQLAMIDSNLCTRRLSCNLEVLHDAMSISRAAMPHTTSAHDQVHKQEQQSNTALHAEVQQDTRELRERTICMSIDIIDFSNQEIDSETVSHWICRYQIGNRPCLLRGLSGEYFEQASLLWKETVPDDGATLEVTVQDGKSMKVCRRWFLETLGPECVVPVRYQARTTEMNYTDSGLDVDNRAVECETKPMALCEYVRMMQHDDSDSSSYYLKDWHLQLELERMGYAESESSPSREELVHMSLSQPCHSASTEIDSSLTLALTRTLQSTNQLYSVPPMFEHDLLNAFCRRFTDGDYRFVYWGPPNSTTDWHVDVLHSFSWSYNVVGVKEWAFVVPTTPSNLSAPSSSEVCTCACNREENHSCSDENTPESPRHIHIRQEAGEMIFVPAAWKHKVRNVPETLSINHNWITTANLHLVWQCIQQEMEAVKKELVAFGINDWAAHEQMLRGCCGLDVTAFYLMVLTRLIDLLVTPTATQEVEHDSCKARSDDWLYCYDVMRLYDTLSMLHENEVIHLKERLSACLCSTEWGESTFDTSQSLLTSLSPLLH
jgi:JmjC domain, hydroxylase